MKFAIFASVDIRPLPGAWVAKLGVVLGVQDHKRDQISNGHYSGHLSTYATKFL